MSCLFVSLKPVQRVSFSYILCTCVYYFLCAYIFIPLCTFKSLLFSRNQLMDASLFCKLFYLLLLQMCTCSDVPAASALSKVLGSEAMNLFFQEGLVGWGKDYMKKKGGISYGFPTARSIIDQDPQVPHSEIIISFVPWGHASSPVTEHNRKIKTGPFQGDTGHLL